MRKRLGMITPSSNSVLEPVTSAMLHGVADITTHFSRFRVTEIALDAAALSQFDASAMLPAADLLADAMVDAVAWNGTSASWLGLDRDQALCAAITARTGIAATTCVLGLHALYEKVGVRRLGLVSPYTDDVLYDPEGNIQFGAWYIGHLLEKFKGQVALGAGSYNAGPKAMMKWVKLHGARPLDEFIELCAYTQTREYMKKVTEIYARYLYFYDHKVYEQSLAVDKHYVKNELTY